MKAILKMGKGKGNVALKEIPIPKPADDEVLIEVKAAGFCHTDILLYEWAFAVETEFKVQPPVVMGHEFAGIVVDTGKGVRQVLKGDPVMVNPVLHCGRCYYCQIGRQQLCLDRPLLGFEGNGGFAEYTVVRETNVYPLAPHVSLEIGALAEPFGLSIHALGRIPIEPGETLLISGPGPVGLMTMMLALKSGAGRVFISGLAKDRERLERAAGLGGVPINVEEVNIREFVMDETRGLGVDVALEASGSSKALEQDLVLIRRGGRLGVLGLPKERAFFEPAALALNEKSIIGVRSYTADTWKRCQEIFNNRVLDLNPIITHQLSLEEFEKGMKLVEDSKAIKVIFRPGK